MSELKKKPVKICSGDYVLRLSKDQQQLHLELHDAQEFEIDDYVGEIISEAKELGVVYGFLKEPEPTDDGKMLIAQGDPVQHGEKAKIKPIIRPAIMDGEQQENEKNVDKDGKVDFRELKNIVNVPAKQLLLKKIPATAGTPGKNIFGESVEPKPGKDVVIKCGPGVVLSSDGLEVSSTIMGKFVMENGKPAVYSEHVVNSDVDMSVGNITFCGELLKVNGHVGPGFKVKCMGDVEITEGINGADVQAGGNLKVSGGLIGEECSIKVRGDLDVDFCENTGPVTVRGSVNIRDFVVQGDIRAEKDLRAMEGKGAVIGGHYVLGGSMHVRALGSDAEVVTEVVVGLNPQLEARKVKIEAARDLVDPKLNETVKDVSSLNAMKKKMGKEFPPEKQELLTKLNTMMPKLMERSSDLSSMEEKLEEDILQAATESIFVHNILYPNVHATIGKASRTMGNEETGGVVVVFEPSKRQIHVRAMTDEERQATG